MRVEDKVWDEYMDQRTEYLDLQKVGKVIHVGS